MNNDEKDLLELTPLMRQYVAIRNTFDADTIIFFQVGDFYELFFEDAQRASALLGIALTARGKHKGEPIPLCGVPIHALDHYLTKLVKAGFKVALCDQLEAPQPGKIVERGVTRVLTPGTLIESSLLDAKTASYLFSCFPAEHGWGLLFGELLTGQLFATVVPRGMALEKSANGNSVRGESASENFAHKDSASEDSTNKYSASDRAMNERSLEAELGRFFPDEILVPATKDGKSLQSFFKQRGHFVSLADEALYTGNTKDAARDWMHTHFNDATCDRLLKVPVLEDALTLFFGYVQKTQTSALNSFNAVHFYEPDDFLLIDPATQRNLELVSNAHDGSRANTLLSVLDGSVTAMGSRTIKKWLLRPLVKKETIALRHEAVGALLKDQSLLSRVREQLQAMGDLERSVGRMMLNRALPHEYAALGVSLKKVPLMRELVASKPEALLHALAQAMGDFKGLTLLLEAALHDDSLQAGTIKPGFDPRLDEIRDLVAHAQQRVIALERTEQEATGINSLKIRYNQAHGFYIEITKTHMDSVPERYTRKQTLVGKERYVTPELLALEHDITHAQSSIESLEKEVFERVKREVAVYGSALRKLAHALATLDALVGFATVAGQRQYVRPSLHAGRDSVIKDGRHPVVECLSGQSFIPNDTQLDDTQSTYIITGPNMGGKSTYLRQVALINVMAQCGSFVPATQASVPLVDRIFTRIGASDNVAAGKSTFLVEMEETATICSQATDKSLVILDEVGRGTSTFDGLAIAQAVVEYIHTHIKARCLFATHYHELTQLQEHLPGSVNYYAVSKKTDYGLVFLYRIVPGIADGSFGIAVARLAQLPKPLVERAEAILRALKQIEELQGQAVLATVQNKEAAVLSFGPQSSLGGQTLSARDGYMQKVTPAVQSQLDQYQRFTELLGKVELDLLTPKAAFDLVWRLKNDLSV